MNIRHFFAPHHLVMLLLLFCFHNNTRAEANIAAQQADARQLLKTGDSGKALVRIEALREAFFCEDELEAWLLESKQLGKFCRDTLNQPAIAMKVFSLAFKENLWRTPASNAEWDALGWLYVHTGYTCNYFFEDYPAAIQAYRKAKGILADQLGVEDYYVAKYIYQELGNIHTRLGDYQAAEVILKRFLDICLQLEAYSDAAQAYSDLSILFVTLGRYDEAIAYCRKGILLPDIDSAAKGLLYGNMATAFHAGKKYEQAQEAAVQALHLLETLPPSFRMSLGWKAGVLALLARINVETAHFEAAEQYHYAAFQLYIQLFSSGKNRSVGKLLLSWARLEQSRNCYDEALAKVQSALAAVTPGISVDDYFSQPQITDLYAENTILESLLAKAEILQALYKQEGRLGDLQLALDCHERAFEVEKQLRRSYGYESSKLLNLEESHRRCEMAIALALQLWKKTGQTEMKDRALAFAERSRSILLMEAMRRSEAPDRSGIPAEVLQREQTLQAAVASAEERLFRAQSEETADTVLNQLDAQVWNARREYADWIAGVEEDYPAYYDLKYNYNTASAAEIQRYLKKTKAGLIAYFMGENVMYSFVLTARSFEIHTSPVSDSLVNEVTDFVKNIESFQMPGADRSALATSYTRQAYDLYRQLLLPLAPDKLPENLLIIPDDVLSLLPFDALLTRQPAAVGQFDHYPYLLWEHNISYGYSATLQLALAGRHYPNKNFAGFAPDFAGSRGFSPLRYNAATIRAAQQLLGGDLYLDKSASLAQFMAHANRYNILHLATHAQANASSGNFSFVAFSDGKAGYDSLFVNDLYLMQIKARLVVLSACQTAVGKVHRGEGVISLARAFLCAGAGSVVNTLWSIDDVASRDITLDFYRHIQSGTSSPEALRDAKKTFLEKSDRFTAHPVYWAGFVSVGDMRPVYNAGFTWPYWLSLIAVMMVVGFGLKKLIKRKPRQASSQYPWAIAMTAFRSLF